METKKSQEKLLKQSGYSDRAIHYYLEKIHVGTIEDPDAYHAYTGPCGDTMEFFVEIKSGIIRQVKFQAIGCAGSFSAGSAIAEMTTGKTVEEASAISEKDIFNHLEDVPGPKIHCITLARKTFSLALEKYKG
jgi:nitrogen fixation NifU-like protein